MEATPLHIGAAERKVRSMMPIDFFRRPRNPLAIERDLEEWRRRREVDGRPNEPLRAQGIGASPQVAPQGTPHVRASTRGGVCCPTEGLIFWKLFAGASKIDQARTVMSTMLSCDANKRYVLFTAGAVVVCKTKPIFIHSFNSLRECDFPVRLMLRTLSPQLRIIITLVARSASGPKRSCRQSPLGKLEVPNVLGFLF